MNTWASAKLEHEQQQLALDEFERQHLLATAKSTRAAAPRKRKLLTDTSKYIAVRTTLAPAVRHSKRTKLEHSSNTNNISNQSSVTSATATQAQPMLFETPLKQQRSLIVDMSNTVDPHTLQSNATLAVLSPTDKRPTELATATESIDSKRTSIRRTLSYSNSSNDDVRSDASIEPLASDRAFILRRLCSSNSSNNQPLPLVGRTVEQAAIASLLRRPVVSTTSTNSNSLFLIGPPGTGKSSSVVQQLALLTHQQPTSNVVRVNCSMFPSPSALYADIATQLEQQTHCPSLQLPPLDDADRLDAFLTDVAASKPAKHATVLVLDEVDQLLERPSLVQQRCVQDMLQFFVRYAALATANVTFLGILNGVDKHALLESLLLNVAQVPHVLFPAYNVSELLAILQAHVRSACGATCFAIDDVIEPRALELMARKVASRDGDVRRATSLLQQCARASLRRSAGLNSDDTQCKITLRDVVVSTATLVATSGPVRDVQQLPRVPKILLFAITQLAPSGSTDTCDMNAVSAFVSTLRASPSFAWVPPFTRDELQTHVATLECYALVKRPVGRGRGGKAAKATSFWTAKLTSGVTLDVVARAFEADLLLTTLFA